MANKRLELFILKNSSLVVHCLIGKEKKKKPRIIHIWFALGKSGVIVLTLIQRRYQETQELEIQIKGIFLESLWTEVWTKVAAAD